MFGAIALFVGSFVIANSLSITIAQRTREFATLRTLGASRRQILGTVVLEALVTGFVAAVAGLFLGLAIATGLFKLFDAIGFTLPNNGLVFETRTIVVALIVGVLVTVLASLRPAWRATRVPPIAAVREGATLAPGGSTATASVAACCSPSPESRWDCSVGSVTPSLDLCSAGVLLLFIGMALFSAPRCAAGCCVLSDRPLVGRRFSSLVWPFIAARLAAPMSPLIRSRRWSVVVLTALIWPFILVPLWAIRRSLGRHPEFPAGTPGWAGRRPSRWARTASAIRTGPRRPRRR